GAIQSMTVSGATATGEAIAQAVKVLRTTAAPGVKPPPGAIVLLSDGSSDRGRDPVAAARAARRAHIPVYTVALGTPNGTIKVRRRGGGMQVQHVPPDPQSLAQIAQASGGRTSTARSAAGLSA